MLLFRDVLCPVLYHQSGADHLYVDLALSVCLAKGALEVLRPGCSWSSGEVPAFVPPMDRP